MGGAVVLLVVAAIGSLSSPQGQKGLQDGLSGSEPGPTTPAAVTPAPVNSATTEPTAAPTLAPTPKPVPALTTSQRNAIAKAQDYLDYTSFSRSGLIDQLEYEGFNKADSTFAVDSLNVDWNQQAYLKALDYLDYTSFSLSSLTDQLVYEGFTKTQAKYGATKAYGG